MYKLLLRRGSYKPMTFRLWIVDLKPYFIDSFKAYFQFEIVLNEVEVRFFSTEYWNVPSEEGSYRRRLCRWE